MKFFKELVRMSGKLKIEDQEYVPFESEKFYFSYTTILYITIYHLFCV